MKKLLLILFFSSLFSTAFSQGIYNNGAYIVTTSSANIYVDGGTSGGYTSAGTSYIQGNASSTVTLEGNFTNNSSTTGFINPTNLSTKLVGATQIINGSASTTFGNVECAGTGTKRIDVNTSLTDLNLNGQDLFINGFTLTIDGAISGANNLFGSATSNLTITSASAASATIKMNSATTSSKSLNNLTMSRTNGISLSDTIIINGTLDVSNGTITTNGKLILESNSTQTANVAAINSGGVSGDVIARRFIPGGANKRKWRFLSSPVNVTGSIALSQFIDDIHVTGTGGSGAGFDNCSGCTPSIRTYDEPTTGTVNNGWTNPTNISNTITTATGVEVFVRGSRSVQDPFLNWSTPNDATIDYIGALNSGTINKSLSFTNNSQTLADGFNLVGNPYASVIDWQAASGWVRTNMQNFAWVYDAVTATYGVISTSGVKTGNQNVTRYIPSGQAFFVRATSASAPRITFTENVKCKQIGNSYFKPNKNPAAFPMLRMTLIDDSADFDEALILIDSVNGTPQPTDDRDAAKFFNDALNIYTVTANKSNLAFNAINVPGASDTINVSVWSYDSTSISTKHHKISFSEFESIDPSINLYLLDNYLNVVTNIRSTNEYDFMITTDVNSYGNGRFKIILNNTNTSLPTTFKKQNIVLYPNPANEKLYLQSLDFSTSTINYIIYDLMGREIMKGNSSLENSISEINIDTLEKGNYLIRVSDNTQTNTMKFVKR